MENKNAGQGVEDLGPSNLDVAVVDVGLEMGVSSDEVHPKHQIQISPSPSANFLCERINVEFDS